MKISREWLQTFFEDQLPDADKLAEALTFHVFEIDGIEGDVLDVKVTPNRGHDCLSHRGIAKELSAILELPLANDPLKKYGHPMSIFQRGPETDMVKVRIEDAKLCPRFTGALVTGITVGSSPDWLRKRLEAVGQKSINNVVDATNYVMFGLGQPLHAFDVQKIINHKSEIRMTIRKLKEAETFLALDDQKYELSAGTLVIANEENALSIAGIKGGGRSGVIGTTTDVFLEAANWEGTNIRKTSQALKLRTDASERFQQVISPELAAYGLRAAAELIVELAGGKIEGFVDEYPGKRSEQREVEISLEKINAVLGTSLDAEAVVGVLRRLNLPYSEMTSHCFSVEVPFERLDIEIPEDLIEEVGRIIGYENVSAEALPAFSKKPEVNPSFYAAEKRREELVVQGYSEVYTSVFVEKGERAVANKIGGEKPRLRTTLVDGLEEALERNTRNKDVLGLGEVKIFEIGVIWKGDKEVVMLGIADAQGVREEELKSVESDTDEAFPISDAERYQPFSKYPFIVRDIALWVPADTKSEEVLDSIRNEAGDLLVRSSLFDEFKKDDKVSYAFRLVFQSFEKTLTDEEVKAPMERVAAALAKNGWTVR